MRNDKAGIPMLPDLRVADVVASFLCCVIFYKLFHLQAKMVIQISIPESKHEGLTREEIRELYLSEFTNELDTCLALLGTKEGVMYFSRTLLHP